MNKKSIDATTLENELKGASLFFPTDEALEMPKPPADAEPMTPSNHDTMSLRHHETIHAPMTPTVVESIRKAVKLVGKEAATHRFTPEEKQAIADIIYTYRRQGCDTSENEIARIAINWLVSDHQAHGEASILACVLKALNE